MPLRHHKRQPPSHIAAETPIIRKAGHSRHEIHAECPALVVRHNAKKGGGESTGRNTVVRDYARDVPQTSAGTAFCAYGGGVVVETQRNI